MGSKSEQTNVLPQSRRQADLEEITRKYSMEIGRGAYGVVYKVFFRAYAIYNCHIFGKQTVWQA